MRDKVVETMRIALTLTGLTLLVVFGARAAGQAQDMQLAGATTRHRSTPQLTIGSMTQLNPLFSGVPNAINLARPLGASLQQQTVAPKPKLETGVSSQSTTTSKSGDIRPSSVGDTVPDSASQKLEAVQQKLEQKQAEAQNAAKMHESSAQTKLSTTPTGP